MQTKVCPGCGETKQLDEFYINKRNKDGRQTRCKACQLAYQAANRERAKERSAEWRRKHGIKPKRRVGSTKGGPGTLFPELGE